MTTPDDTSNWRNEPATEDQQTRLRFFGCTWDEGITAGQASDALEECARQFPSEQIEVEKWCQQLEEAKNRAERKQIIQENSRTLGIVEAARRAAETWRTLEELDRAAKSGDHLAQFTLGMRLLMGWEVLKDDQEAVNWFRKSAEQGNSAAQERLGSAYALGQGVAENHSEAAKWYRLSAEQGNATAQDFLGDYYRGGDGVPQDFTEAAKWYRLAAEQGNAPAQFGLGLIYYNGDGVP